MEQVLMLMLMLTSEPLSICDIDVIQPFANGDHTQVICSLFYKCTDDIHDATTKRYDWTKAED